MIIHPEPSRWKFLRPIIVLLGVAGIGGYVASWVLAPSPLPGHVSVPSLRGLPADEATTRLEQLGLRIKTGEEIADPHVAFGQVAWQSPVAESQVPKGSAVHVGLSSGSPAVVIPDVEGFDLDLAREVIRAAALKVGRIDSVVGATEVGVVTSTRPDAGSATKAGAVVELTVSSGAPEATVPSLVGLTIRDARNQLTDAGFRAGEFSYRIEGTPGRILEQSPAAGMPKPRGTRIDLIISGMVP